MQTNRVNDVKHRNKIVTRQCIIDGRISGEWKAALASRMPGQKIQALSELTIFPSNEEKDWTKLIISKALASTNLAP